MGLIWLYPVIVIAGMLQALGPPMNGQLRQSLVNPWLATLVSFGLVLALFHHCRRHIPPPSADGAGLAAMPWWRRSAALSAHLRSSPGFCSSTESAQARSPQ